MSSLIRSLLKDRLIIEAGLGQSPPEGGSSQFYMSSIGIMIILYVHK